VAIPPLENDMMSKYNIDLYRMEPAEDGTIDYYTARRADVKGALETGHVTHLSRYGRTVAMRKYTKAARRYEWADGRGGFAGDTSPERVTYSLDIERVETIHTSLNEAIDIVIDYLNNGQVTWEAGDCCSVFSNQASRSATCLAVIGTEVLVEYEMPGTTSQWGYNRRTGEYRHPANPTSALRIFDARFGDRREDRSVPHRNLQRKWIDAIHEQGTDQYWIGMGQRMLEPFPLPAPTLVLDGDPVRIDVAGELPRGQARTNTRF